jgi:hypothetical protein
MLLDGDATSSVPPPGFTVGQCHAELHHDLIPAIHARAFGEEP